MEWRTKETAKHNFSLPSGFVRAGQLMMSNLSERAKNFGISVVERVKPRLRWTTTESVHWNFEDSSLVCANLLGRVLCQLVIEDASYSGKWSNAMREGPRR
jgi:hypothetical protein